MKPVVGFETICPFAVVEEERAQSRDGCVPNRPRFSILNTDAPSARGTVRCREPTQSTMHCKGTTSLRPESHNDS